MTRNDQAKVLRDLGLDQKEAEQVIACSAAAADLRHESRVAAVMAEVSDLGPLAGVLLLRMEEAARKGRLGATPPTSAWVGGGSGRRHARDGGAWCAAISDAAFRAERGLGEDGDPYLAGVSISARFAGCGPTIRWAYEAAVAVALDNQRYQAVQKAAAQAAFYLWARAESDSAYVTKNCTCPVCGASAGDTCRAPNGLPKPLAHLGRVELIQLAAGDEPVANCEESVATDEVAAQAGE